MVFVVMELHAHHVVRMQNLLFLYQIFVTALPGGREQTVSALRVWLANTNPIMGLLRVLRVQPRNIRMLSMHPHTRVKTVPLIQSL